MRPLINRILALAAAAMLLTACATADIFGEVENVEQAHYATVSVFNEYDRIGAKIFNNPNTPNEVRIALNAVRKPAVQALKAANDAFIAATEIQNAILAEEDPALRESLAGNLVIAAQVLRGKVDTAAFHVENFRETIKSYD